MLPPCKICRREYTPNPRVKLRHGHEQGLCPDCLFLCRRQNQLEGPEKTILRSLHEYLVRQGVADEKRFVLWNNMPGLAMPDPPRFWSEAIFGFFLKRWYAVTYVVGGNREQVAASHTGTIGICRRIHSASAVSASRICPAKPYSIL